MAAVQRTARRGSYSIDRQETLAYLFCEEGVNLQVLFIVPVQVENRVRIPTLRALKGAHAVPFQFEIVASVKVVQADVDIRVLVHIVLRWAKRHQRARNEVHVEQITI